MIAYINMFEKIKTDYPKRYKRIIQVYLSLITEFYENNQSLATIEILDKYQKYRNEPNTYAEFSDVYERYGNTAFLTDNLTKADIGYLKDRYLQGLAKLGKEYDCVI